MTDKPCNESKNITHPLINELVQLQELIMVRSEQQVSMTNKQLSQLDSSIQSLMDDLPPDTRSLFLKMQKKDILAIVPIYNNICAGCGLTLPVSMVYAVRAGKKLYQCTHCARILYYPDVRPRRIDKKKASRLAPRQTGIARFSSPSLMIPKLIATEQEKVIGEFTFKMEEEGFVDDGAKLLDEALKREAIINTAVNNGIAFPHVRGVEGGGLTMAVGISRTGVKYDTSTRMLTHIIFFIVIPTAASVFYLRLLSGLTQTFAKKENREKLLSAQTPEELWNALVKTTRYTIK